MLNLTSFDQLSFNCARQTLPLTTRDSGSAFINQYLVSRGSSSASLSVTPFAVASRTGVDSRFVRFRGVTFFFLGISFTVQQHTEYTYLRVDIGGLTYSFLSSGWHLLIPDSNFPEEEMGARRHSNHQIFRIFRPSILVMNSHKL